MNDFLTGPKEAADDILELMEFNCLFIFFFPLLVRKNIVVTEEITLSKQFLHFPQCFHMLLLKLTGNRSVGGKEKIYSLIYIICFSSRYAIYRLKSVYGNSKLRALYINEKRIITEIIIV